MAMQCNHKDELFANSLFITTECNDCEHLQILNYRGGLRCILFGVYVHISRLWNGYAWFSVDGWSEKCGRCLWKERRMYPIPQFIIILCLNFVFARSIQNLMTFQFAALSRLVKIIKYWYCNVVELWQTCATSRFTCHISSWDRTQFWITGKFAHFYFFD